MEAFYRPKARGSPGSPIWQFGNRESSEMGGTHASFRGSGGGGVQDEGVGVVVVVKFQRKVFVPCLLILLPSSSSSSSRPMGREGK